MRFPALALSIFGLTLAAPRCVVPPPWSPDAGSIPETTSDGGLPDAGDDAGTPGTPGAIDDAGTPGAGEDGGTSVVDAGEAPPDAGTDAGLPGKSIWKPMPGQQWQWQLTGMPVDQSVNVPIYDIDAEGSSASTVASLHAAGRRVICYIDVGAVENYRNDAWEFAPAVVGNVVNDWPDERFLDIRALDGPRGPSGKTLREILEARIDVCASKGFDALEPDLLENYLHSTGFPLTEEDQLAFNRFIAGAAHARGLAVALKNDKEQPAALVDDFDFAIDEECQVWHECTGPGTAGHPGYAPFVQAGKAVLNAEYTMETSTCGQPTGFSSILKNLSLDAWRVQCPH